MIAFDNTYARLPDRFHARLAPTPVKAPRLIAVNAALAAELGLDPAEIDADMVVGNRIPEGAQPIAEAYAGHQFGHFTPQLGDGRAILMGEVVAPDGTRRDLQWKGSGPTPFSRRGDGRAALGPVLREYLISEAMHALGVPTTRTLAAATTGEYVFREDALPGAVLIRVAASHIRVGTFQYFAARGDQEAVRLLADHAIARHYPEAANAGNPYLAFFEAVVARQAALIPHWLLLGFIHGVMNTDNCAISGETIDYGPCAFLDAYAPGKVFSSIDQAGRYAYGNQPRIAQWNLARLAETLLPLFSAEEAQAMELAQAALAGFAPRFQAAYLDGLRAKCGLAEARDDDAGLIQDLLQAMADNQADFTLTFRALAEQDDTPRALFADPAAWDAWAPRWRERLAAEPRSDRAARMRAVNPAFIPRNHRVEEAIVAAVQREDFAPFHRLLAVVTRPYEDQPEAAGYLLPPKPEEAVTQTFCGT